MAALQDVHCGFHIASAARAVVVCPVLSDLHHAAHCTEPGRVLAKPALGASRLFLKSFLGGPPVDVFPVVSGDSIFSLPVVFHFYWVEQFVDLFLVQAGEFVSADTDGCSFPCQGLWGSGVVLVLSPVMFGSLVHSDVMACPPVKALSLVLGVLMAFDPA